MRVANWLVLTIAAGIGGYIVGIDINNGSNSSSSTAVQTLLIAVATVGAAFGGAWAAYKLQSKRLDSDKKDEQLRALNSVQLSLHRAYHLFEQISTDTLNPYRNNERRFLLMPNSLNHNSEMVMLRPETIVFVLDERRANFLLRLSFAERNIISAIYTFNKRSIIHREKVLPVLEEEEGFDFENFQRDEIITLLGLQTFGMILSITDLCYDSIDNLIVELKDVSDELAAVSVQLYPGEAIISAVE